MDLNEISIYIKVVQTGSFSKAAKILGMPKSTVSTKVSNLEKRLNTTLIQRTTRKLNVTPAGEAYFKGCIQGLEEIQAAETELTSLRGEPSGNFRITAPIELGSTVLPELIAEYTRRYPKVSVEVILTGRKVDLVSENVDLAIRAGNLKDSTLIAKKIGSVYFALFASPKYLKNKEELTHPRELNKHRCLHFSLSGSGAWRLSNSKGTLDIPVKSVVTADDFNLLKIMTLRGEGICYLPAHYCNADVKSGKLVRVLPEWKGQPTAVHFVYPPTKYISPKLSAFMNMSMDIIKENFSAVDA